MSEDEIDRLEAEFPRLAAEAFATARREALASGLSVVESRDGFLVEVFPNGEQKILKEIPLPVSVNQYLGLEN